MSTLRSSALGPALFFLLTVLITAKTHEVATVKTSQGDLHITFVGHGTLIFTFAGKVIHIDPFSAVGDYTKLPKADAILITHSHGDHLDPKAIQPIRTETTQLFSDESSAGQLEGAAILKNGQETKILGVPVQVVAAYNLKHKNDRGEFFHPKGWGNGYLFTFGDKRVYVAGDTEDIPEMAQLKNIDIAFLPMNIPYTMTPEMTAKAARSFNPKTLYPYHTGDTITQKLVDLLKNDKDISVVIKDMRIPKNPKE